MRQQTTVDADRSTSEPAVDEGSRGDETRSVGTDADDPNTKPEPSLRWAVVRWVLFNGLVAAVLALLAGALLVPIVTGGYLGGLGGAAIGGLVGVIGLAVLADYGRRRRGRPRW